MRSGGSLHCSLLAGARPENMNIPILKVQNTILRQSDAGREICLGVAVHSRDVQMGI